MAKAKIATAKDIELNRWCIEMAMKWPVHSSSGYSYPGGLGGAGTGMGYVPPGHKDEDVLGRAKSIRDWVNGVF